MYYLWATKFGKSSRKRSTKRHFLSSKFDLVTLTQVKLILTTWFSRICLRLYFGSCFASLQQIFPGKWAKVYKKLFFCFFFAIFRLTLCAYPWAKVKDNHMRLEDYQQSSLGPSFITLLQFCHFCFINN